MHAITIPSLFATDRYISRKTHLHTSASLTIQLPVKLLLLNCAKCSQDGKISAIIWYEIYIFVPNLPSVLKCAKIVSLFARKGKLTFANLCIYSKYFSKYKCEKYEKDKGKDRNIYFFIKQYQYRVSFIDTN